MNAAEPLRNSLRTAVALIGVGIGRRIRQAPHQGHGPHHARAPQVLAGAGRELRARGGGEEVGAVGWLPPAAALNTPHLRPHLREDQAQLVLAPGRASGTSTHGQGAQHVKNLAQLWNR